MTKLQIKLICRLIAFRSRKGIRPFCPMPLDDDGQCLWCDDYRHRVAAEVIPELEDYE